MQKYGIDFKLFAARPDWFATADTDAPFERYVEGQTMAQRMELYAKIEEHDRKIEQLIARAHRHNDLSSNLVFLGRFEPEAIDEQVGPNSFRRVLPRRIFLIPNMHPAEVAREFELGSHASYLGGDVVEGTYEALKDLYGVAPFTPTFLDIAGLHAKFVPHIDRDVAEDFLETLQNHGCPGAQGWGDEPDDQHIIDKFVREQKFHFWWD
jgi:hypothetical protein